MKKDIFPKLAAATKVQSGCRERRRPQLIGKDCSKKDVKRQGMNTIGNKWSTTGSYDFFSRTAEWQMTGLTPRIGEGEE